MAKPGKKKDQCKRYKESGRREENKRLRQQRAEKRLAKFAARKEAGKTYQYQPNPYEKGTTDYRHEANDRAAKNADKRTEYQQWKSHMRKLQNDIDKKEAAIKMAELKKAGKKDGRSE